MSQEFGPFCDEGSSHGWAQGFKALALASWRMNPAASTLQRPLASTPKRDYAAATWLHKFWCVRSLDVRASRRAVLAYCPLCLRGADHNWSRNSPSRPVSQIYSQQMKTVTTSTFAFPTRTVYNFPSFFASPQSFPGHCCQRTMVHKPRESCFQTCVVCRSSLNFV